MFLFVAIFVLAIPVLVGALVYRDAKQREGCNPWLWAIIAAVVPSFVGVIIYVIVRADFPVKTSYDEFGNRIPQKPAGFPTWAKVVLVLFVILIMLLIVVMIVGGCSALGYRSPELTMPGMDDFYYNF